MNQHLCYFLSVTDDLSDQQLETVVAEIRAVRRARNEGAAYARAMDIATGDISARWDEANSPEGRRRQLVASLIGSGMTADQVDRHFRSLGRDR